MTKMYKIIASGFGVGYLKPMPGTYASLLIFIIGYLIKPSLNIIALIIFFILLIISYYSINQIISAEGGSASGGNYSPPKAGPPLAEINKDPSWIVIDEVLGSILILIFIPYSLLTYIMAFIIFRLFDGQKIWPINVFNKIKTPLGVIIDDLLAAIITIFFIYLIKIMF